MPQLERDIPQHTIGRRVETQRGLVERLGRPLDELVHTPPLRGGGQTVGGHRQSLRAGAKLGMARPGHGREVGGLDPFAERRCPAVQLSGEQVGRGKRRIRCRRIEVRKQTAHMSPEVVQIGGKASQPARQSRVEEIQSHGGPDYETARMLIATARGREPRNGGSAANHSGAPGTRRGCGEHRDCQW